MRDNPFRKALDGWTEDKWTKKAYVAPNGATCALGRLGCRGPWDHNSGPLAVEAGMLRDVAAELFPWLLPGDDGSVAIFNDAPVTTFTDVCQVFEKAAVRWEEQQ